MSKITKRKILERLRDIRSKIEMLEHQIRDSLNATTDENSAEKKQRELPDDLHELQSDVEELSFSDAVLVGSPKNVAPSPSCGCKALPAETRTFMGCPFTGVCGTHQTCFLRAAYKRCQPCVVELLRMMVDVNCTSDHQECAALDWAIHGCKEEEINASNDKMVIYLDNLSDKKGKR